MYKLEFSNLNLRYSAYIKVSFSQSVFLHEPLALVFVTKTSIKPVIIPNMNLDYI